MGSSHDELVLLKCVYMLSQSHSIKGNALRPRGYLEKDLHHQI